MILARSSDPHNPTSLRASILGLRYLSTSQSSNVGTEETTFLIWVLSNPTCSKKLSTELGLYFLGLKRLTLALVERASCGEKPSEFTSVSTKKLVREVAVDVE
ncbi:hypothetical protein A4A49_38161 [Nicotiana attenuata]|uniref:Uncharacterized protein n=1 Tax=Nicotiana attenuata TaxID=49451 RepID=A0A1J6KFG3_NICAT|nr:hypothetical protein A4A49_38161 [Nicotiana attenuata]